MILRNILIVAATRMEIAPLLSVMQAEDLPTGRVRSFMWKQMPLDILITGPGMVATAFFLGKVRGFHEYSLVVNAGIAGSFNKKLATGSCVNVVSDCFADLGSAQTPSFVPLYSMEMASDYTLPGFDRNNVFSNSEAPHFSTLSELVPAKGITVNTLTGKAPKKTGIEDSYLPDVETMEGAAFFFACKTAGVHGLQIRAISNRIGTKTAEAWDIPAAVDALHLTLLQLLDEL